MTKKQVGWRFSTALIARIEAYARRDKRSTNNAAEVLLEAALEKVDQQDPDREP